ncbi:MAG: nicotinate phosphoribosyltransferase [Deltaproteobacteria bacterium SG8_13]|nr:MAG: nicotinate phosphoribosyltransferase [Deltaproteobacteria bacterium SG8_13]
MKKNRPLGPLFADLYELTMAAGYFAHRMAAPATFSLFIRGYPPNRNYFVAAGLQDALQELESSRFTADDIDYLKKLDLFSDEFLTYLRSFRFTGSVTALPEGTLFFADEPIAEVTAPLIEAQVFETFLLNTIGFQTMIASKAARCVHAAAGRPLIDFSLRRTQGRDAGLKVARSTYLAGFNGTSNVLAGQTYGIPVSGTMAHSFVQAFEGDYAAFAAFADVFPGHSVFLIDTYDTRDGARQAVRVAEEMKKTGHIPAGVRLDSGDMAELSRQVRRILDAAGLQEVKIFASSGFDEYKIAKAIGDGARIDAFGVGTNVGVSADAPFVDIVYKLVRTDGRDVRKLSPGKKTLAGEKQVFRETDSNGQFLRDAIGCRRERFDTGEPLLQTVMRDGRTVDTFPTLEQIRDRFADQFERLPERYKTLDAAEKYPVAVTADLEKLQQTL